MLVELISRSAGEEQEHRKYYPSPSKSGQCTRALTYYAIGVKQTDFPDRAILIFDDGHMHEAMIKDRINKTAYKLTEMKGQSARIFIADIDGQIMDGEIDGIIEDIDQNKMLLEIKSINHFGFNRLDTEPQGSHKKQSNLYMHGLRKLGLDISKALILYKNKNTAAMKEFIIDYDEELALADIQVFRDIAKWAKKKQVPPRQYDRDKDWQCGYCRFEKICYEGYEAEFNALDVDVDLPEELVTEFKYYLEVSGQRLDLEKEEKALKDGIKQRLKDQGVRSGRVGEYTAKMTLISKKKVDLELIPEKLIRNATKVSSYEKLTIRRFTLLED